MCACDFLMCIYSACACTCTCTCPVTSLPCMCSGGSNFVESCIKSLEPDDVTIGVVVGEQTSWWVHMCGWVVGGWISTHVWVGGGWVDKYTCVGGWWVGG